MPYDYSRTDRISEQIKRELAMLIRNEVKDPRIGMVSILDVVVTKDLDHAKVYFDTIQQDKRTECQQGLNRAAGFLRSALSRTIQLRNTPSLTFIYDDTEQKANDLSALIDKAIKSDQKNN
jgi:ribosome-binding factor A